MRDKRSFLSIPLFILILVTIIPNNIHPVGGQLVGLVCLSPSATGACPASPVTVSSPVGTQMSVSVIIQGSAGLDGFDITLKANHTIIKPADTSLTGSMISGGPILVKCIGGLLRAGSICSPTDTLDTIHLIASSPPGSALTIAPTSGLLFTAIFNVTGTSTTPISFQTGCLSSSVNSTTICVDIANGTPVSDPETIQEASYTAAPTPTFTIGTDVVHTEIFIQKGATGNSTILLTSVNGFSGTVSLSMATTPTTKHPPSITLSSSSVALATGGFNTVVLSASATANTTKDTYTVTVTGTSGSQTGSVRIQLTVAFG